ncbi:hypothetical protein C474_06657 [Halogeometricum pallidum JCM 14848]|uniref:Uncharacterized protein n=1 Tax=Halogeometricum pallidum JCM 14848 TaxID=1227487 RepID=M0DAK8_HALPD|nr:hypothetical protein [Halogeometricum pallidum]ELZ32481.1 hypothetical protein C474_06657 [Halogeometricum pallidum JCM 14848]
MSVNFDNKRNVGVLFALLAATVVAAGAGILWLRGSGEPLIVEVGYTLLVLLGALAVYDRFLVQ